MSSIIRVSVPGKAILMGEHAAVYGRPALVTAIDRRMHLVLEPFKAEGTPSGNGGLRLALPQVNVDELCAWQELENYAAERRDAWHRWSDSQGSETPMEFSKVLGNDPAHLVKVAAGETLIDAGAHPRGSWRMTMRSDIPLGSGFGSSAAATVAVCKGLWRLLENQAANHVAGELDAERLHRVSLEAERRQHGSPSGVDNATVIHGGALWVTRDTDGLKMEKVEIRNRALLDKLRIFHSGAPAEATGEVVAAVAQRRQADPEAFDRDLDAASELTLNWRRLLESEDSSDGSAEAARLIQGFGQWLEKQGAVPPKIQTILRQVEEAGGVAKISGAGSLTGDGAGSLLIFHPEPQKLDAVLDSSHLQSMDVSLGAEGARFDS